MTDNIEFDIIDRQDPLFKKNRHFLVREYFEMWESDRYVIAKIGEKITIGKTKTITNDGTINAKYLHTVVKDNLAKLAVAVSLASVGGLGSRMGSGGRRCQLLGSFLGSRE